MSNPPVPRQRVGGFTIVEMLVVVSVIALLVGLLLPAIGRARATSRKTQELNSIREVFRAWTLYANTYDDAALPGYLSPETQTEWNTSYEFADRTDVSASSAAPYPWRLMRFLDYNHEVMHGRLEGTPLPNLSDQAAEIAQHPAFAYNALYVGGWWEQPDPGQPSKPRYAKSNVVARWATQIADTQRVVLFCSASVLDPGLYRKWPDSTPGSHFVVPPNVAGEPIWASGVVGPGGLLLPGTAPSGSTAGAPARSGAPDASLGTDDVSTVRVLANSFSPRPGVPICRYTGAVAVLWADGSCNGESPGTLSDQRRWIYRADSADYTHGE